VEDDFCIAYGAGQLAQIANVSQDKARTLRDVRVSAAVHLRGEIVINAHFVTGLHQCIGSMGPDKPRAPGNEYPLAFQMDAPKVFVPPATTLALLLATTLATEIGSTGQILDVSHLS
jgi:hypothetical protein